MSLIDERSLDSLDFETIRERLAARTHSDRATERARALEPATDLAAIRRAVTATTEMRVLMESGAPPLARVVDSPDAVGRAERGATLAPLELYAIATAMAATNALVRRIRESELPTLDALTDPASDLGFVAAPILAALDERGEVLDRASPELARIRRAIANAQNDVRERTAAIARSNRYANALQDAIVTIREGRYVVPVKAEFAGEVPGIVHDSSASGATLFVEPLETLEVNNRLRSLRAQEEHEIARILGELSALVGREAERVERNLDVYAELDLVAARADVAVAMRAVPAHVVDDATIAIVDGRHPLLGERAVPQSLHVDAQTRLLLISGPNMGGKSVALKMVGLALLMTYCGMHVPALEATIGGFTRVFTDIGDQQSIAENASTFSAHLARMADVLAHVDDRSLILIDEIGSGTEPRAGAALAIAMLERFLAAGARTIATTHAGELKIFAHETPGVANASVRFDPETYAPTYELDLGAPGQSLAFPLARKMRIDSAVVERAESLLSSGERDYERALDELANLRAETATERDRLAGERRHLQQLEDNARRRADALERERREFARSAEERLTNALRAFTAEMQTRYADRARPRVTPGQAALLQRTIGEMRRELGLDRERERGQRPALIGVGDRVRILSLDQEGTVTQDNGESAVVAVGAMHSVVKKSDLRRLGGAPSSEKRAAKPPRDADAAAASAADARTELDVRGRRFVEAEPIVERWIDESLLSGYSPLRLIHGKGTGLLGRGLQQYLKSHPHVRGVRYGNEDEGGSGVTVFELR